MIAACASEVELASVHNCNRLQKVRRGNRKIGNQMALASVP